MSTVKTVSVGVVDGTQVLHDGKAYGEGETVELPAVVAHRHERAGLVRPTEAKRPRSSSRRR